VFNILSLQIIQRAIIPQDQITIIRNHDPFDWKKQ
jgi:hypothetical protein